MAIRLIFARRRFPEWRSSFLRISADTTRDNLRSFTATSSWWRPIRRAQRSARWERSTIGRDPIAIRFLRLNILSASQKLRPPPDFTFILLPLQRHGLSLSLPDATFDWGLERALSGDPRRLRTRVKRHQ